VIAVGAARRRGSRLLLRSLFDRDCGRAPFRLRLTCGFLEGSDEPLLDKPPLHVQRRLFVNRAGVRLLVRNAELREQLEDPVRLDLELSRQLVDADFTHR
jgi:hypothetical protein